MKYQIVDWAKNFENDRSRSRKNCSFVCVPNKQHGMGFSRIMAEPDGAAIYGIWHCIVGACSQQPHRDGWLTFNGEQTGSAWGVDDMALKFRRPHAEVERALSFLSSDKVGWIKAHDINSLPDAHRALTAHSPSTHLEEKRREEKEEKESAPAQEGYAEIPSWDEFWTYCQGPQCNLTAEWFARDKFLAAESANWERNQNWRAYARRCQKWWESDGRPSDPPQKKGQQQTKPKAKFLL